jgi:hypothetical protein
MAITFPANPESGQEYVADNTVTYQWTGTLWSTLVPWDNRQSQYVVDGGNADQTFNENFDNILDGGTA